MILGETTLQSVSDQIVAEGCPYCGELPGWIDMVAPGEIILEGCGHVIDATEWIREGAHGGVKEGKDVG